MKRVNFVSLDFLTLQWFCNTLQTQHPQTQAAKELYDALEALYAGKSDSLMLELGEAIPEAASTSLVCGNLLIDSKSRRVIRDGAEIQLTPKEFDILYFLARNRLYTQTEKKDRAKPGCAGIYTYHLGNWI